MKTVINKTRGPIKIPLPRGKALHLGPGKTGQIRDEAAEHAALKKLIDAGGIEIVEGGERESGAAGEAAVPHKVTRGRGKSTFRQKKGDR
ncbi:MAG: hypothetical protein ACE5JI_06910 [Acidobacteriota bacterium]